MDTKKTRLDTKTDGPASTARSAQKGSPWERGRPARTNAWHSLGHLPPLGSTGNGAGEWLFLMNLDAQAKQDKLPT